LGAQAFDVDRSIHQAELRRGAREVKEEVSARRVRRLIPCPLGGGGYGRGPGQRLSYLAAPRLARLRLVPSPIDLASVRRCSA
jgi:hypothetical protein